MILLALLKKINIICIKKSNKISTLGISKISKGLKSKTKLKNIKLILDGCGLNTEDMLYIGRIIENRNLKSFYLNISK